MDKQSIQQQKPGQQKSHQEEVQIIEEKISKVNGEIAIKKYQRGNLLGKGGFAKCYEVINLETKKKVAAKIIPKSSLTKSRARQKLISEIKIHKSLHHPGIVQFEHVFEDHDNVYILLEMCANQTLNELIKRRKKLTDQEVQYYLVQAIQALKYLHSNRVIHRDLKLGNLFLGEQFELKLGDFGLATKLEFDGEKKRTICGTPNYIAPEILDGKVGHSFEVDIWSLGVVMYTLLIGKPPFETQDVKETYKKIKQNSYSFPEHGQISENAKNLIQKILQLDPSKRPTLDEIFEHPFINKEVNILKSNFVSGINMPPCKEYVQTMKNQIQHSNKSIQAGSNTQRNIETQHQQGKSSQIKNLQSSPKSQGSVHPNTARDYKMAQTQTQLTNFNSNQIGNINLNQQQLLSEVKSTSILKKPPLLTGMSSNSNNFTSTENLHQLKQVEAGSNFQQLKDSTDVWVIKWVDYSSKYGLGYLLSNGSSGVVFNDATKIVLDPSATYVEYYERKAGEKSDKLVQTTLQDYPKEMQKKITLLQHFKNYLEDEKQQNLIFYTNQDIDQKISNLIYAKKWIKTRHAIMFRLSNKIVQVNFTDLTEIILNSEKKIVTYVNKKGERSHHPLSTALESPNQEMSKRLKYTKDILTHMLNANQKIQSQSNENEQGKGTQQISQQQQQQSQLQTQSLLNSQTQPQLILQNSTSQAQSQLQQQSQQILQIQHSQEQQLQQQQVNGQKQGNQQIQVDQIRNQ